MKRLRKKSIESISFQFDLDLVMYVIPFTKRFEGNNWQKRPGASIGFFLAQVPIICTHFGVIQIIKFWNIYMTFSTFTSVRLSELIKVTWYVQTQVVVCSSTPRLYPGIVQVS